MRERTQLAYVWFAGSFLDALFKRLFSCIRLRDEDVFRVKYDAERWGRWLSFANVAHFSFWLTDIAQGTDQV